MWVKFPLHVRGVKKKVIELMSVANDFCCIIGMGCGIYAVIRFNSSCQPCPTESALLHNSADSDCKVNIEQQT